MFFADRIEATLLRPDSTEEEVRRLCMAAKQYKLAAVGAPPVWARFAVIAVAGSPVRVDVTVGYPLGTHTASAKGLEARLALEEGASEVTVVPNLTAYKSERGESFRQDIAYVAKQCRLVSPDALVKVLLYIDLLDPAEQRDVARVVQKSGAHFLMLATLVPRKIQPREVDPLFQVVAPGTRLGVMGNVRTPEEASALLNLGLERLATPWGVEIVKQGRGA